MLTSEDLSEITLNGRPKFQSFNSERRTLIKQPETSQDPKEDAPAEVRGHKM